MFTFNVLTIPVSKYMQLITSASFGRARWSGASMAMTTASNARGMFLRVNVFESVAYDEYLKQLNAGVPELNKAHMSDPSENRSLLL